MWRSLRSSNGNRYRVNTLWMNMRITSFLDIGKHSAHKCVDMLVVGHGQKDLNCIFHERTMRVCHVEDVCKVPFWLK